MQPVCLPSRVELPNGDPETVGKRLAAATKTTEILETISRSGVGWKIASYGLTFIQAIMGIAMLEPSGKHNSSAEVMKKTSRNWPRRG
jgi:hypothetical protein